MGSSAAAACQAADGFCPRRLERVFAECFALQYNTELVGGTPEPLYEPGSGVAPHRLYYREDYFASALHEVAHWCIAGPHRRTLKDFGYWYEPDGRAPEQQTAFEQVEYRPQALEWHFSRACGYPFRVSIDNLDGSGGDVPDSSAFKRRIAEQAALWQSTGLPPRAACFAEALGREFNAPLEATAFRLSELD
jgi:elongation factor P hydroxylase